MPQMTTTEVLGFCDNLFEFMKQHETVVKDAGISTTTWQTEVDALKQVAVTRNGEQETLKRQLGEKTQETEAALDAAYKNASTKLDALVGALGKTTPLGKQAAKLRSDVLAAKKKPKKAA